MQTTVNVNRLSTLAPLVREWISRDHSFRNLLDHASADGRRSYIVGGAVRAFLMGDRNAPRDLDIVLEEGSGTLLEKLGVQHLVERRAVDAGTVILPDGAKADVFSPSSFRPPCRRVEDMLKWFDLIVNAIAVPAGNWGPVVNPISGIEDARSGSTTLVNRRWAAAGEREVVHLMMRLAELANRLPNLVVRNPEVLESRLSELRSVQDWGPVLECHGMARSDAVNTLLGLARQGGFESPPTDPTTPMSWGLGVTASKAGPVNRAIVRRTGG
jgi:hypothetical protein